MVDATLLAGLAVALLAGAASNPAPTSPAQRIAAQARAMAPLAWMDGRWRGPAFSVGREGRHEMIQTERIGPFLDGSVKVIEGKSLDADGKPAGFNALGVVSYDPDTTAYAMHSYAEGRAGDFALRPTPDGYVWEVPAGPQTVIRYTAVHAGNRWTETGVMVGPHAPAGEIFRMTLTRVGDTDWPAGDATPR